MIEPELSRTDVAQIIREKIADYDLMMKSRNVNVTFGTAGTRGGMLTDGLFVSEIFGVLLGNALKITPHGSKVRVQLRHMPTHVEVRLADEGPGLPEQLLESLQKPLSNTYEPALNAQAGGQGLGLYMARKYAALLKGSIHGRNLPGRGAEVWLVLPHLTQPF
jgi:signal transduction histidine kinase